MLPRLAESENPDLTGRDFLCVMARHVRSLRLLRYYLLHYQVLGFPLAYYLLAGLVLWLTSWLSSG